MTKYIMTKKTKARRLSRLIEAHLANGVAAVRVDPNDSFEDRMDRARKGYLEGFRVSSSKPTDYRKMIGFRYAMDAVTRGNPTEYNKAILGVNSTQLTRNHTG